MKLGITGFDSTYRGSGLMRTSSEFDDKSIDDLYYEVDDDLSFLDEKIHMVADPRDLPFKIYK